jgi:hypothetical protein
MENKINIAELLKDCPEGMELNCLTFNNVFFQELDWSTLFPIICYRINNGIKEYMYLTEFGSHFTDDDAKCVIFPKGKTTWEGFQRPFKNGDIVAFDNPYRERLEIFIFKDKKENNTLSACYLMLDGDELYLEEDMYYVTRFATEEEKAKLFDTIKANGYKWNAKTKTLEKLTESKEDVDDEILMSGIYFDRKYHADEVELHLGNYEIEIRDGRTYAVLKNQKTKTFELPKFKVGDEIKQIGSDRHYIIKNIEFDRYILNNNQFIRFTDEHIYELAPNKLVEPNFNVGDEIKYKYPTADTSTLTIIKVECDKNRYVVCDKPNNFAFLSFFSQDNFNFISKTKFDITTLVPFESRVLVRDNDYDVWRVAFWGYLREKQDIKYDTTRGVFRQCIPYECNEHLLGKTEDCTEYFKTW